MRLVALPRIGRRLGSRASPVENVSGDEGALTPCPSPGAGEGRSPEGRETG